MSLIVQKYGGSSVADIASILWVARRIKAARSAGHDLVVVVSAMGDETDRLEALAHQITPRPSPRELDVLLATGEQVSIALLCIALESIGCAARSYVGAQIPIYTSQVPNKARIEQVEESTLRESLKAGQVAVIAGFQGISWNGDITTLGRGGSDTTAVAVAAALGADECQVYTDVEGVYTADPRYVPKARRKPCITFAEMLELASLGTQVLQMRAVELAWKYEVPLRVLSTFKEGPGTLVTFEGKGMEKLALTGIALNREEARLTLRGIPNKAGVAGQILMPISQANIEVDLITQCDNPEGLSDFNFTVHRRDYERAFSILQQVDKELGCGGVVGNNKIVKLSLVGVGLRSQVNVMTTLLNVLGGLDINVHLIATSEIKVSVVIDEKYLELSVRALHEAFGLDKDPYEEKDEGHQLSASA